MWRLAPILLLAACGGPPAGIAPSAITELPRPIAAALAASKCQVPQNPATPTQKAIAISGEFARPGQTDWAVLCNDGKLYIFHNAQANDPEVLDDDPNAENRFLAVASTTSMSRRRVSGTDQLQLDHDGIDDGPFEKPNFVRYFSGGKWHRLTPAPE